MNNLIDNRQIRIFISSTFRDMQDERDYLMKRTFPKLRMLAAERDVTLTELDLRWGITEEESKSGKVVEICLREIENSIPFFIGIIGNRYGWIPLREDLGGNVTDRFTDVNRYIDQHLSVTEMEMQFGVLERKEDMHAYFFVKKKKGQGSNSEKLIRLKEEVAKSRYPSSTYNSSQDLGRQVEKAFINLLDTLFPKGKLSELEMERIGQRSFLNQLCQNYIKDEKNFAALDAWLADEASLQMVVTGESGLGKSALIANWVKEKLADNGCAYNIIYHFTGNGGSESSREHITKHIAGEINDIYGWNSNVCLDKDGKLEDLFAQVSTAADKPLIIVIDAVNQIVDAENAKLLNWLPAPGKNIKLIFSTLEDDRTMEALKRRNCATFTLHPLDADRRAQMVRSYLRLFAKSLTDKQVERIVNDQQCENTLVLRTLLDELINFGIYEKLDKRIEHYLAGETTDDFYQALLASYEHDFKDYGKNFVKDILSLIAVSKDGLTETAIMSISKTVPKRWSELYCCLAHDFCNKNGKISFAHIALREAIEKRYKLKENGSHYRNAIANNCIPLFEKADKDAFLELPYQLYMTGSTESAASLYSLMKSPAVTATIAYYENSNCHKYWQFLRNRGYTFDSFIQCKGELIDKAYNDVKNWHMLHCLTRLLNFFGEHSLSLSLEKEFVECLESCPETSVKALVKVYNDIAEEYSIVYENQKQKSDFNASLKYYTKALKLAKRNSLAMDMAVSYNGLASLCIIKSEYDCAVQAAQAALKINVEKYGEINHEVACNYNTLANAYEMLKRYDDAVNCYKKSRNIMQTLYGKDNYQLKDANYNLADTLYECKRYDEAKEVIDKALYLIEHIYGNDYYDLESYLELKKNIEKKIKAMVK